MQDNYQSTFSSHARNIFTVYHKSKYFFVDIQHTALYSMVYILTLLVPIVYCMQMSCIIMLLFHWFLAMMDSYNLLPRLNLRMLPISQ